MSETSQPDSVPADYMGPKSGPFECEHCAFAEQHGHACTHRAVVKELGTIPGTHWAPIEPHGCCNKFKKAT